MNHIDIERLSSLVESELAKNTLFRASLQIVLDNTPSTSALFLIGGTVYRTLTNALYRRGTSIVSDHDFLAEHVPDTLVQVGEEWRHKRTSFGALRLVNRDNPSHQIDFCRLRDSTNSWASQQPDFNDSDACIASYLEKVPLDVQSIAFDWRKKCLLGEAGIRAIVRREVGVHNRQEADCYAAMKRITLQEYLQKKATSLGFTPKF